MFKNKKSAQDYLGTELIDMKLDESRMHRAVAKKISSSITGEGKIGRDKQYHDRMNPQQVVRLYRKHQSDIQTANDNAQFALQGLIDELFAANEEPNTRDVQRKKLNIMSKSLDMSLEDIGKLVEEFNKEA